MLIASDFNVDEQEVVETFQRYSDKSLCNEYLILHALYEALDNMIGELNTLDTMWLNRLDLIEQYLVQEICMRFCGIHSDVKVPRYPLVG